MEKIAGKKDYGQVNTNIKNHCFIPTISSLDISTSNLFYNIAEDSNILSKTPFDAIYYPTDENEKHVHISSDCVNWLTNELAMNSPNKRSFKSIEIKKFKEQPTHNVTVYPNPTANGKFSIQSDQPKEMKRITVQNIQGITVFSTKSATDVIDISLQPEGVYLVTIILAEEIQTLRIIKK